MSFYLLLMFGLCLSVMGCKAHESSSGGKSRSEAPASSAGSGTPNSSSEAIGHVEKSDAEWRRTLTPEQYSVLREKGTERAFTGQYDHHFEKGTYTCAACGLELFTSDTKFNSGCGWPAFFAAKAGDRVKLTPDYTHGMKRVEVTCARCGSHLGHIFDDAPDQPTGQRYCINSVSLKFIPAGRGSGTSSK